MKFLLSLLLIVTLGTSAFGQAIRQIDLKKQYPELFKGGWILVFSDHRFCVPCRTYSPTVNLVSKTHKVRIFKPREHKELSEFFSVKSIPTTIIFVDGRVRARKVGPQTKQELLNMEGADKCKRPEKKRFPLFRFIWF